MFKTLKKRKSKRSGRQFNNNDTNFKQTGNDKRAFHSRNRSTNFFPDTCNPIPKPRNHAVNLMNDNFFDSAGKPEFEKKENLIPRWKYTDTEKTHVKSPVYFTYDQTTDNYEPIKIRFSKNVREQERPHKRSRNNHCAQGSQNSNASKTMNVESTMINNNLEFLKKSVEMFKNSKEEKFRKLGDMLGVTPSEIINNKISNRTKSQSDRTETLLKSKNIYRSKYTESNRSISSNKSSNDSLYSPTSTRRTTIRIRRKPTFSDDFTKSIVLNSNESTKASKYYISSQNTLAPNSKRQFSPKSTQTLNDDDCCFHRSSSTTKNLNKKVLLDNNDHSSKQQSPHSVTTSAVRNEDFSKRKMFPTEGNETKMKSENMDRYGYNNSHKKTESRNPSSNSSSPNENKITTNGSYKSNSRTQKQESNEDFIRSQISPAPSSERQSSQKSTETKNDDNCCLHRSSSPPIILNKTSVPDHSGYNFSEIPTSPLVKNSSQNDCCLTQSVKPPTVHNNCFINSALQPLTLNDCCIKPPELKQNLSSCSSVPILKIPTNQDNFCFEPMPQPLIHNGSFCMVPPLNMPVNPNNTSFVEPFQSCVKEQIQPSTPNMFCFEPPTLGGCFSIPILKTTTDQENCCFEPLSQPERQNESVCLVSPLNIPANSNNLSFVEPTQIPVWEPIQNGCCCCSQQNSQTTVQNCFCCCCQENLKLASAIASYLSPTHYYCGCFNGGENVETFENPVYYQPCNNKMLNDSSDLPYQQAEQNHPPHRFTQPSFIPRSGPTGRKPIFKLPMSKTFYPNQKENSKCQRKLNITEKNTNSSAGKKSLKSLLEERLTSNHIIT